MSPFERRQEMLTRHSRFSNAKGTPIDCACENCKWMFSSKSQSSATRAAKLHIDAFPEHRVLTYRRQVKVTYARLTTVLR